MMGISVIVIVSFRSEKNGFWGLGLEIENSKDDKSVISDNGRT